MDGWRDGGEGREEGRWMDSSTNYMVINRSNYMVEDR